MNLSVKNSSRYLLMMAVSVLIGSCGPSEEAYNKIELSRNSAVNDQLLSSFDNILTADPALGQASLFAIKNLADKPQAFFATEDKKTLLNPSSAKKAQELIENILSDYDMKAVFDAVLSLASVFFNDIKSFDVKNIDISLVNNSEIFDLMTCDEFIEDPYFFVNKVDVFSMFSESVIDITKTISGCKKITLDDFRMCIKNINDFARVLNQDLSCSIKNKEQLSQLFRSKLRKSFDEIKEEVDSCIDEKFKDCGYDQRDYFRDSILDFSFGKI